MTIANTHETNAQHLSLTPSQLGGQVWQNTVKITFWRHAKDNVGREEQTTFGEFYESKIAPKPTIRTQKDGAAWSPGSFSLRDGKRRKKDNALEFVAIGLDYEAPDGQNPTSIETICKDFQAFCGFWHTTHSHTPDRPRLRVILVLSRSVNAEESERITKAIVDQIVAQGHLVDTKTTDCARLWFLPAISNENAEYRCGLFAGEPLDVDSLLAASSSPSPSKDSSPAKREEPASRVRPRSPSGSLSPLPLNRAQKYAKGALENLLTAIRTAPDGTRNNTLNTSALQLFQYSKSELIDEEAVCDEVLTAALENGLTHEESSATIESARSSASPRWPCEDNHKNVADVNANSFEQAQMYCGQSTPKIKKENHDMARNLKLVDAPTPANDPKSERFESTQNEFLEAEDKAYLNPHKFTCTDTGNGERFAALYSHKAQFCPQWGKWLIWSGKHWQVDEAQEVRELAKNVARNIFQEASQAEDEKRQKDLGKWAFESLKRRTIDSMLKMAESEKRIVALASRLDTNNWLLNVKNGTLNLKTGKLKPHDRKDLITKLAHVEFDPSATCPMWVKFLDEITANDNEIKTFLQQFFGYCLTGDTSEHVLVSCWGQGSNGKTTLLKTLFRLLGDYCTTAPSSLLMAERFAPHPTDKTILFGKRLVACIETPEGRLDELKVKELTGGDEITARRMREDFWSFQPTHKLLLATNHRPEIKGQDFGIWRRQRLVPFTVQIPKERQDKELAEKLIPELSGILNWALTGCLALQKAKMKLPNATAIDESVEAWREASDWLGPFIEAVCVVDPTAKEESARLFSRYVDFAQKQGDRPITKHAFAKRLEAERSFKSVRGKAGQRFWQGLRINEENKACVEASGDVFNFASPPQNKACVGGSGDVFGFDAPSNENNRKQEKKANDKEEKELKVTCSDKKFDYPRDINAQGRYTQNALNTSPTSPNTLTQEQYEPAPLPYKQSEELEQGEWYQTTLKGPPS